MYNQYLSHQLDQFDEERQNREHEGTQEYVQQQQLQLKRLAEQELEEGTRGQQLTEQAQNEGQDTKSIVKAALTRDTEHDSVPTTIGERAIAESTSMRVWRRASSGFNEQRELYPAAPNRRACHIDVSQFRQDMMTGVDPQIRIQELDEINKAPPAKDETGASSTQPNPHAQVFLPIKATTSTAAVGVVACGTTTAPANPMHMDESGETPYGVTKNGRPACNPRLYKTKLCRNWERTGTCAYDRICKYAHGSEDIRPVPQHPMWKTKPCTAHSDGTCIFKDEDCCYIRKSCQIVGSTQVNVHANDMCRKMRQNDLAI